MKNVVILGCENSHADAFLKAIRSGEYADLNVLGVYSEYKDATDRLSAEFGVYVMKSFDEFAGKVDAVIVTARDGKNHLKYARPYLDDQIPMFIDKPITCSVQEANEFMGLVKEKKISLCGGTSLIFLPEIIEMKKVVSETEKGKLLGGNMAYPVYLDSPYSGFWFYAQHLVQCMTEVFGQKIEGVTAHVSGENLSFIAHYPEFDVTATYGKGLPYYHISVFRNEENGFFDRKLSYSSAVYKNELGELEKLLAGEPMKESYESFFYPVYVQAAIEKAMESGKTEKVVFE